MKKIQNKLTVSFIVLIFITMSVALVFTLYLVSRQFHINLSRRLQDSSRGIDLEIKNLKKQLLLEAKAISADEDVIRAFKTGNTNAVLNSLENIQKVTGKDLATAIDTDGTVLGRGHRPAEYGDDVSQSSGFISAKKGRDVVDFSTGIPGMGIEAFAAVKDGKDFIGVLKLGELLGYEFAKRLKAKYGLEIIIYDRNRLQASTFKDPKIFGSYELDEMGRYVQAYKKSISDELEFKDEDYYVLAHPLISEDRIFFGGYFMAISQLHIHNTINILMASLLLITVALILISFYISHMISAKISNPLKKLSRTALEVAGGDLSKKVEVTSDDEVGLLAESFNTMTEGLRKTTTSIKNLEAEIEKRKEIERKLSKSNEDYERLLDNLIGCFMFVEDISGNITYVSKSVKQVLGYDFQEFLTHYSKFLTDHPVNKNIPDNLASAIKGTRLPPFEVQAYHKDGSTRWLEVSEIAVRDNKGNIISVEGVAYDITQRVRALESLSLRDSAINQSSNGIIISRHIDKYENPIIYVNKAFERITGYSLAEVKGKDCRFLQGDDRDQLAINEIRRALQQRNTCRTVLRNYRKDGTMFWNELNISPVFDDYGALTHYIGVTQDITERVLAEQEREKLLKSIQVKKDNLQSIVYVASHDLRSPLVNIDGFTNELAYTCNEIRQILEDSSIPDDYKQKLLRLADEDISESIKYISASASKMSSLLEGLLQVSRIGTTKIEIETLNINSVIEDIQLTMEYQIKMANVELVIENMPDCLGDRAMINQVFSNIMGNAIKYLDPERKGKIHISARTDGDMSVYCIEDNGIGISQANQQRIFEIFQRVNPDDKAGGEGLGLSIVTRILDRLEGRIWVESEPGKGSRFYISLPAVKSEIYANH